MALLKTPSLEWQYGSQKNSQKGFQKGSVVNFNKNTLELDKKISLKIKKLTLSNGANSLEVHGKVTLDASSRCFFSISPQSQESFEKFLAQIRKNEHLQICETEEIESKSFQLGFDAFQFTPCAIPELDYGDLSIKQKFLRQTFNAPLLITGMTGGIVKGQQINRVLAKAAQKYGIPMGVGSQRLALSDAAHAKDFQLKKEFPNLFLIGNLGIGQLLGKDAISLCQKAISMIEADALAIHVNVLQECIQGEGDKSFKGFYKNLEAITKKIKTPIIIKEVGVGLDPKSIKRLIECGVSAVDFGGSGGTSWAYIEGLRSSSLSTFEKAQTFRDFGFSTPLCLKLAQHLKTKNLGLIATGGIRDGLAVAKCLALGADMVGMGLPLLRAAMISFEELDRTLERIIDELKITMMVTGSKNLKELKSYLVSTQSLALSLMI